MEFVPAKSWKAEFARSADSERHREILRRANEEIRKRDDEERKAERESDLEHLEAVVVLASQADLDQFDVTLDHYDGAIYDALIENERLLDESRERLKQMFEQAHVLPDGRRVFESEDGVHVFDERGAEIAPELITADELDDALPKWETWQAELKTEQALQEDRGAIIEFQDQVADARAKVEEGNLTQDELDDLKSSLEEQMPESVRAQLPADQRPTLDADVEPSADWRPAAKLEMPQL